MFEGPCLNWTLLLWRMPLANFPMSLHKIPESDNIAEFVCSADKKLETTLAAYKLSSI